MVISLACGEAVEIGLMAGPQLPDGLSELFVHTFRMNPNDRDGTPDVSCGTTSRSLIQKNISTSKLFNQLAKGFVLTFMFPRLCILMTLTILAFYLATP